MEKKLVQSKTFWGGAIMLINGIAKSAGYDLGDVTTLVDVIVNLIGAFMVFKGRIGAIKRIKSIV